MFKFGKYYIFHRHTIYGSALVLGTFIGTKDLANNFLSTSMYVAGALLIVSSLIITITVNKFPEDFRKELKELNDDEEEF